LDIFLVWQQTTSDGGKKVGNNKPRQNRAAQTTNPTAKPHHTQTRKTFIPTPAMPPTPATGMPAMAKQSTPKTMASGLMTMKFMQRGAAAAAAAAAAGTPEASSPATPRSEDRSGKRRKFSHTPSAASSPATPLYDQKAIQAALEEEEKK